MIRKLTKEWGHGRLAWQGIILVACSCARPAGPATFPVTGVVTRQGRPVEGATVSFEPVAGSENDLSSQAVTDAEGRFSLQTHVGNNQFQPGLKPGEYGVAITKLETMTDMRRRPKNVLPRKFSSTETSGLVATVVDEDNEFTFALD